jgi:hypothetical protein
MSEIKKFYTTLTALPRIKVGDRVFRKTLRDQYEEALVVSILSPSATAERWSATIMTKNGVEHMNGNVEHRSVHDWMPVGWQFDKTLVGWIPPKEVLRDDSKDAADIEDPVAAADAASKQVFVVPTPWEGEKFMSWRSRVLKSVPALKGKAAVQSMLSESWKSKQYEITI